MDWKICAIDDLRRYRQMKIGALNSRDRLRTINATVKEARLSANNIKLRTDSRFVDAIVESERLRHNISATESLIKLIERGLDSLSEDERKVLDKFYISDSPVNFSELKEELGYENRSIYRLRDHALQKFTLAMYGVEIL